MTVVKMRYARPLVFLSGPGVRRWVRAAAGGAPALRRCHGRPADDR